MQREDDVKALIKMVADLTASVYLLERHIRDLYIAQGHTPKEAEALMLKKQREWSSEALGMLLKSTGKEADA